jgi:hypothetical protein
MSKETKVVEETKEVKKSKEEMIMECLNSFMQQEIGNKVTQFNMQGLAQVIGLIFAQEE